MGRNKFVGLEKKHMLDTVHEISCCEKSRIYLYSNDEIRYGRNWQIDKLSNIFFLYFVYNKIEEERDFFH